MSETTAMTAKTSIISDVGYHREWEFPGAREKRVSLYPI